MINGISKKMAYKDPEDKEDMYGFCYGGSSANTGTDLILLNQIIHLHTIHRLLRMDLQKDGRKYIPQKLLKPFLFLISQEKKIHTTFKLCRLRK